METSWGQVDHDAVLRADEAAVDHRAFNAMRAFLDRLLGEAHEDRLGQRGGGDVDLDFDREGFDAQEREGVEFGEHGCRRGA